MSESRTYRMLHCFADYGTEAEVLSAYGDVVRVGIDPQDTNESAVIQADAHELPFAEDTQFQAQGQGAESGSESAAHGLR